MDTERSPERWVTHREAAELWGIKEDSARLRLTRYAREQGWRVLVGNSGKKRYRVPGGYEFSPRASGEQPPEPPAASPEQPPDQSKEISRLSEAVATLAEQLARAHAELDAERRKGLWTRAKEAWRGH